MRQGADIKVRVDRYTRVCLTAIAVLMVVMILGLWADGNWSSRAGAGDVLFDSSSQRNAQIEAQQQTNAKLDELIKLLKSGEAKVQMADAGAVKSKASGGGNETPKPK